MRNAQALMLVLSASASLSICSEPTTTRQFTSPDGTFQLTIPTSYGVFTGGQKPAQFYIPICHNYSVVCITLPTARYEGTTFGAASLEVTLIPAQNRHACLNPDPALFKPDVKHPQRMINGTRFLHAITGGAAMSHDINSDLYRGYINGTCYQLALQIAFSAFQVYDLGSIKEFTAEDEQHVRSQLERILDSFRPLN